jgi:hypothetical protein
VKKLAIVVIGAAFVVLVALYVTGPGRKETTRCSPPSASVLRPPGSGYGHRGGGCTTFSRRTNAWERLKGAVTGNP